MSVHRTDLPKPVTALRDNPMGIIPATHGGTLKSCYRCGLFSTLTRSTAHPIYKLMCPPCKLLTTTKKSLQPNQSTETTGA